MTGRGLRRAARARPTPGTWSCSPTSDTEDWRRPGVDAIVAARHAGAPGAGAVVMLHDGGGDRVADRRGAATAAADADGAGLPLHHRLGRARPRRRRRRPAPAIRLRGQALRLRADGRGLARARRCWSCSASALALALLRARGPARSPARVHVRRRRPRAAAALSVPRAGVGDRARLQRGGEHRGDRPVAGRQRLPGVEVIVVDDGSTDGTADIVRAAATARRPGDPPAQRRQAGRAQHRHRARPAATCWSWSTATPSSSPTPSAAWCSRSPTRTSARSAATPRSPTGAGCSAAGSTSST